MLKDTVALVLRTGQRSPEHSLEFSSQLSILKASEWKVDILREPACSHCLEPFSSVFVTPSTARE